jgi:hypothetical protein
MREWLWLLDWVRSLGTRQDYLHIRSLKTSVLMEYDRSNRSDIFTTSSDIDRPQTC